VILRAKQNYNSALFFQKKGLNFLVSPSNLQFFEIILKIAGKLKYRISTKVRQRIFSRKLLMNSEEKADKM
jgi:hypothetical protein